MNSIIFIKTLVEPIDVYYVNKHPFPYGIQRAWSELEGCITDHSGLKFFGLFDGEGYMAGCNDFARLKRTGEFSGKYSISAGEYLAISITNWQEKKEKIALAFQQLEKDARALASSIDIEYYKSNKELICLKAMK